MTNSNDNPKYEQPKVPFPMIADIVKRIRKYDSGIANDADTLILIGLAPTTWYGWAKEQRAPKYAYHAVRDILHAHEQHKRPHPLDYLTLEEIQERAMEAIGRQDFDGSTKYIELLKWCHEDQLVNPRPTLAPDEAISQLFEKG